MATLMKRLCIPLAGLLLLAGCASTRQAPYTDLASAPRLKANTENNADRLPFVYAPAVEWWRYSSVIIEPVVVYNGVDNHFGDMPMADRTELANYMQTEFGKALAMRFTLAERPRPGTLRIKLTLTGAKTNTAVVSTATRFDLVGAPINIVQSIRGKEGVFIGSVSYSVEVFDAVSQHLLKAYVAEQYPNAMNVAATFGRLAASRTGLDKGAEDLLVQLQ
jgi:hypothetical protein